MIERIAQCIRNGASPGQKFLVGRSVAGDIPFGDAVGAYGTPFVVVALKPDFEEIGEAAVPAISAGER